jgi:acyl CoA:acetate/3-ketoacid CoA transferase alpha subunit
MTDLTVVSNNAGTDEWGLGILLKTRQVYIPFRLFMATGTNMEYGID